jgi:quinol monooxygenase YgiN
MARHGRGEQRKARRRFELTRRTVLAAGAALTSALDAQAMEGHPMSEAADPIVELRQYTLYGGRRDTLIELFEHNFRASQDKVGSQVLGTFRDLDDPDRFVWLRSFKDMPARSLALDRFYSGPEWKAHREAANATMVDSDNVLLLRRLSGGPWPREERAAGLISAVIHYIGNADAEAFVEYYRRTIEHPMTESGGSPVAWLATHGVPNNFPRLPVREGEKVVVVLSRWSDPSEEQAFQARLAARSGWRDKAPPELLPAFMRKPERLRLEPTRTSRLR